MRLNRTGLSLVAAIAALSAACVPIGTTDSGAAVTATPVAASSLSVTAASAAFVAEAEAGMTEVRGQHGLQPLTFDQALFQAAQDHATDMALNGFRSHRGSDGSSFRARAARSGSGCAAGENIFWGGSSPASAYNWWLDSPTHRDAMLRPRLQTFGLAEVNNIWVLVLGRC